MRIWHALLTVASLTILSEIATAGDWPRFRGPNGSGVATDTTIPSTWSANNFRWRIDLPGVGHGSPVVWGERLFLLSATESEPKKKISIGKGNATASSSTEQLWMPLCISTKDGSILWKAEIADGNFSGHRFNSPASSTPAVDGKRVVFTWGTPEKLTMAAFSHTGTQLWKIDLGPVDGNYGYAGSPILYGDLVILNNDQENGSGSLLAVDATTGAVRWTVKRHSKRLSYSVPCLFEHQGRTGLMFTNWQHGFTAIDPSSGAVIAEESVFNLSGNERAIGSPVTYRDLIIGTCGFVTGLKECAAVRMNDREQLEVVWRTERNVPHVASVLVVGDQCYLWNGSGVVTCLDAATGKEQWKGRLPGIEGACMGSPVSDGHSIFCADESGNVHVIAVGGSLQVLASNALGDLCRSTPALGDGALFVRTASTLTAVEGR